MRISLVNLTETLSTSEIHEVVRAVNRQIAEDFAPYWHVHGTLRLDDTLGAMGNKNAPHLALRGDSIIYLVERQRPSEVLGYHERSHGGVPYGAVHIDIASRLDATKKDGWTVTLSHEVLELLADPHVNLLCRGPHPDPKQKGRTVFHWYEMCDAVQAESYEIDGVSVSNFVLPAYFTKAKGPTGHCDFLARTIPGDKDGLLVPFGVKPGGYVGFFDPETSLDDTFELAGDEEAARRAKIRTEMEGSRRRDRRSDGKPAHRDGPPVLAQAAAAKTDAMPAASPVEAAEPLLASALREIRTARARLAAETDLPDREMMLNALACAEEQAQRALTKEIPVSDAVTGEDDRYLSLVLSSLRGDARPATSERTADDPAGETIPARYASLSPVRRTRAYGDEMAGVHKYNLFDASWLGALWHRMTDKRVPFPRHRGAISGRIAMAAECRQKVRIAVAGDWGTGDADSDVIMQAMRATNPDYTIHLGDVYYSGTEAEERRFVERWLPGRHGALALNSNHEMYSGGRGYFNVALKSKTFGLQNGLSYFALSNDAWTIVGVDSAYDATGALFGDGHIDSLQRAWLKEVTTEARAAQRKVIVLSHHHGLDFELRRNAFWDQVIGYTAGDGPDYWYWGHIHAVATFHPEKVVDRVVHPRCVGHGGVPYAPVDAKTRARLEWAEDRLADDAKQPKRALNGFLLLDLDGPNLTERFIDERGNQRWP